MKFRVFPESKNSFYFTVCLFDSRQAMFDRLYDLNYKTELTAVGAYVPLKHYKRLGYIFLLKRAVSFDVVSHEIQHALLHWAKIRNIKTLEENSYTNERMCEAAGKLNNDIISRLVEAGCTIDIFYPA